MPAYGESGENTALRVHVASTDVPMGAPPRPPKRTRVVLNTIVLTANSPFRLLVPLAPDRQFAIVQALDNPVVLADSLGQAQNVANTGDPTLAAPEGAVVPVGVAMPPIAGQSPIYVAAATYPSRVSVIAGYTEQVG